jgi:outer membrane protein assembly factor BamB
MYCLSHLRPLLLTAAMFLPGPVTMLAQEAQSLNNSQTGGTEVNVPIHLHWDAPPGVSRYRLQLASDSSFADIVFDRAVVGNDYQVNELPPGKYFWRIAPLTNRLGEFSSARVIYVRQPTPPGPSAVQSPSLQNNSSRAEVAARPIVTRGGWRAAVGDIAHPVLAHLRSAGNPDLVGINSDGVVFALDSASGIALWSTNRKTQTANSPRVAAGSSSLLLLRSRSGLDNVVVMSGLVVTAIEGATGRELWRATLPAAASSGTVVSDGRSSEIFLIDNSLQRAVILDARDGNLVAQVRLPHRVVGAPVTLVGGDDGRVVLAYDNGQVEIRSVAGVVVRAGDAGSPATTAPLSIRGRRGDLILVGTRGGLTALTADLSALGMVAIKGDAPRGTLAAADLNGDGSPEVIMMTERGRVVAVSADDGKTLWEANVFNEGETVAFADVNGDRVLDVLMTGGPSFALAISGRDGSVVWKDNEVPALVANHSVSFAQRSLVVMPYGSGALLIAGDPSRTALRAMEFPKGTARPNR